MSASVNHWGRRISSKIARRGFKLQKRELKTVLLSVAAARLCLVISLIHQASFNPELPLDPSLSGLLSFQTLTELSRMEDYLPKDAGLCAGITVLGMSAFYALSLVIYRLFFSPIAQFPGPKLAAVTSWYELYYDVVHKGKYLFEIEKMHDKYGEYYSLPHCL